MTRRVGVWLSALEQETIMAPQAIPNPEPQKSDEAYGKLASIAMGALAARPLQEVCDLTPPALSRGLSLRPPWTRQDPSSHQLQLRRDVLGNHTALALL